jgi:hypothetical protein
MKRVPLALLALAFCLTLISANKPSGSTDFSGNWVLNFEQTKNPPAGLQDYRMVVKQDERQLKVTTTLEGNLQDTPGTPNPGAAGSSRVGYPGRRGGMGIPGAGMGMPRGGGGSGGSHNGGPTRGDVAAYQLYPKNAVYNLDGSESSTQLGDSEQTTATSKAVQEKTELKLSLMGKEDSGESGGKIRIKEHWQLSDDGKTLKVDRTVKSPDGSGNFHLVFSRKETESSGSGGPKETSK